MPKSNTTSNDMLKAVLKGTDPAWRSGSSVFIALHTADPTASGDQSSNEGVVYTNYQRVGVLKTDWNDNGTSFTNMNLIQFPQCGVAGATVRYVSIGTVFSGSGQILYSGQLNSELVVANLIQPQFSGCAITVTES